MMNKEDNGSANLARDKDTPSSGRITLPNGKTARVDFDIDEAEQEAAQNTLKFLIANETQIRQKIAVSLFKHFRDWIPDDINTPERLVLRIDLSDILLWEGGGGQLYYYANGDDDLFTSHAICVRVDADGEIDDEVELAG
jgi:hypothetical protein